MATLIVFFVFNLCLIVGLVLLCTRRSTQEKTVRARIVAVQPQSAAAENAADSLELFAKPLDSGASSSGNLLERLPVARKLERLILYSGSEIAPSKIVLSSLGIAAFATLVAGGCFHNLWAALGAGLVASFLPLAYLLFLKSRRLKKFNDALPDAIDLMSRALRAGHSTGSSIEVIALQSPEPLAGEFAACFQQQKFGMPFRDAIVAMGERIPSEDLHFFITAILVQKETGGDLIDILDRSARLIRERLKIQGEIRTYTAQGRLTGYILSALPIVMLVALNVITPGYSDVLFHDQLGEILLGGGALLILIGSFIIGRIVDIKV